MTNQLHKITEKKKLKRKKEKEEKKIVDMNILSSGKSNEEKYTRLLHISEFIKKIYIKQFLTISK